METPQILDDQNVEDYFSTTVLPVLPAGTEITGHQEVTENTFVNWVFAMYVRLGDTNQEETVYVRQSRGYAKKYESLPRDPGRVSTEAKALAYVGRVVPGVVPKVIDIDSDNAVLVLSDIRLGGDLLAEEFVAGRVHEEVGSDFGRTIGLIQKASRGLSFGEILGDGSLQESDNKIAWLGSRTDAPMKFYPQQTKDLLEASVAATRCFVIGDLSPKNIFVEGSSARFLDLERTSTGDPAYDPAYIITHFLLDVDRELHPKSLQFAKDFMQSYLEVVSGVMSSGEIDKLQNRIVRFIGFSLMHRTRGAQFVSYTGEDKEEWQDRAAVLLGDTSSTSVVEALAQLIG